MNMCKKIIKKYGQHFKTVILMESLLSIFLHKNHVVNWFQLESARRGDSKRYFQYMTGALVAQWVKRWPSDLLVLISSPARSEFFSPIAHSLSLKSDHRSDMTEILLKKA